MDAKGAGTVNVFVCVTEESLRIRILAALGDRTALPFVELPIESLALGTVSPRLQSLFKRSRAAGAILISDALVDEVEPGGYHASSCARDLFAEFGEKLYSTIAVCRESARIEDVDRVVRANCSVADLWSSVLLCRDRLEYLRPPCRDGHDDGPPPTIEARPIERGNQTEFHKYFALRYQVYHTMCYLDRSIEGNALGMEMDWFDTQSVHFGAFVQGPGGEDLVGTARLITTEEYSWEDRQFIRAIADRDPSLRQWLEQTTNLSRIPVLHNHQAILQTIECQNAIAGELSRVIVRRDYRGRGITQKLMEIVLKVATERQVAGVLLECLPIHAKMYRGFEFQKLPGTPGNVYGINRTMVVMKRPVCDPSFLRSIPARTKASTSCTLGD